MDLLTTVRKEGSRGGRGDFKWSDVQSSTHRENYLGHSLMAPVGRWQRGRDLNWYAKGDADEDVGETAAEKAERERKEEIKRIKEAEQDALARALGYDVPPRNPNLESLGDKKEVDKILKEAAEEEEEEEEDVEVGKGVGFGKFGNNQEDQDERILGSHDAARDADRDLDRAVKRKTERPRHKRRRSRSRSRSTDRARRQRRHHRDEEGNDYRRRSRSRSREHRQTRRSRSRDRSHREIREHRRKRTRSPYHSDGGDRGDWSHRREHRYERRR